MKTKRRRSSKYRTHRVKWGLCEECYLCERRRRVVLYRGKIPCDVLFIGEAPGASEDALGKPFVGPAGKLLDRQIRDALPDTVRVGITNLVACIPRDDEGRKVEEPDKEAILRCGERLEEIISISNPDVIVCVGSLAEKRLPQVVDESLLKETVIRSITHPAAILRADVSQQGLAHQRSIVGIRDAWEDVVPF